MDITNFVLLSIYVGRFTCEVKPFRWLMGTNDKVKLNGYKTLEIFILDLTYPKK